MQKVNNMAGRLAGTSANGYKQSDVDGLHGRVTIYPFGFRSKQA